MLGTWQHPSYVFGSFILSHLHLWLVSLCVWILRCNQLLKYSNSYGWLIVMFHWNCILWSELPILRTDPYVVGNPNLNEQYPCQLQCSSQEHNQHMISNQPFSIIIQPSYKFYHSYEFDGLPIFDGDTSTNLVFCSSFLATLPALCQARGLKQNLFRPARERAGLSWAGPEVIEAVPQNSLGQLLQPRSWKD